MIREEIENSFKRYGYWLARKRKMILVVVVSTYALIFSQVSQLAIDTSHDRYLRENHPQKVAYDQFQDYFGSDNFVIITVTTPHLFTTPFLEKLKRLHQEIEAKVPFIDDLISLVNVAAMDWKKGKYVWIDGEPVLEDGELTVKDLLEEVPQDEIALELWQQRVSESRWYKKIFVTEDHTMTTLAIRPMAKISTENPSSASGISSASSSRGFSIEEAQVLVTELRDVISRYESPDFEVRIAGNPVLAHALGPALRNDLGQFTLIAIVLITLILGAVFRRVAGVLLPLVVLMVSLGLVFSIMAILKMPMTSFSAVLPSFILVVGVCQSLHFLSVFFQKYQNSTGKIDGIAHTLQHSGWAITLTSFTTAMSLFSFTGAGMLPVQEFGIYSGIGVLIVCANTLILLPLLLALFPLKPQPQNVQFFKKWNRVLLRIGNLGLYHPKKILIGALGVFLIGSYGVSQLYFGYDPMEWIPEDHEVRKDFNYIDEKLRGNLSLSAVIDTQKVDGVKDPKVLEKMQEFQELIRSYKKDDFYIGETFSLVDVVKGIYQTVNGQRKEYYIIPEDQEIVSDILESFERDDAEDLEGVVSADYSKARVDLRFPWTNFSNLTGYLQEIDQKFQAVFLGLSVNVFLSGIATLIPPIEIAALTSIASSYLISGGTITILMILLVGGVKLGLLSMIPNFLPIFLGLGLMGLCGMPLDFFSILVGSVAIGLVVDDTVHFIYHFQRNYRKSSSVEHAVHATIQTVGNALCFTTVSLVGGFLIYTLSPLNNLFVFGIVTAFIILMALLADLLILPALLTFVYNQRPAAGIR